jgi:hypothetical protein
MTDGLLLFARYAYPPNLLGYCGPRDNQSLLGYIGEGRGDGGLADLARRFEGAYPYLRLIARVNGLDDPFDRRVVEAYWIGNAFLEKVGAAPFYESLVSRFRGRMASRPFAWLASVLPLGAKPHHNFHVFDVYRRAGLIRDERAAIALDRMDQCRISWGRVLSVSGAEILVERAPLALREGRLALGPSVPVRVMWHAVAHPVRPGDTVSLHWNWACDRLDPAAVRQLMRATRRAIAHTNTTL